MKCWYHICLISTAALFLYIGISKCSEENELVSDSILTTTVSHRSDNEDQVLELEVGQISENMLKLTLIDESGEQLEQELPRPRWKQPLNDASNIIRQWPTGKSSIEKSSQTATGIENDSKLFTPKVIYSENGHAILKSIRKSKCQRQSEESDSCKSTSRTSKSDNSHIVIDDRIPILKDDTLVQNDPRPILKPIRQRPKNENHYDVQFIKEESVSFIDVEDEVDGPSPNEPQSTTVLKKDTDGNHISSEIENDSINKHGKDINEFEEKLGLPDCSNIHQERFPVLVISTLDGQISGIDYKNGAVIWSHQTGDDISPLLSSSMSKIEVSSRGEWVRLIPSLDGGIYRFDGENVEALPVTADTLLHSSFKFNEDTIFTGGKVTEVIGISPLTGEIIYVCSSNGCSKKLTVATAKELLVIKRISQTVRAIDPKTGNERWNFSVGHHEVNVANSGCESLSNDFEFKKKSLPPLQFVLPDGLIIGMDKDSQMLWKQKMSSPIVSAWNFINEDLEPIDLFSSNSVPALLPAKQLPEDKDYLNKEIPRQPSLYVGVHQKQLYIQQNSNFQREVNTLLQHLLTNAGTQARDMSLLKVQWQPYLATALSRTPVVHHGSQNHPLLLDYDKKQHNSDLVVKHKSEYPYDNGYYLFGDEAVVLNDSDHWIKHQDQGEEQQSEYEDESFADQIYYICFQYGPMSLWKLLGAMAAYGACHILFIRFLINHFVERMRISIHENALMLIRAILHNTFRENPQLLRIMQRLGIHQQQLLPPPTTDATLNASFASSTESHETQRQDSNFSSRYTSDFEPIGRLGKGGFGVVFHMKNKLDENEYAIKRIVLPKKESSAERVKREVRALAKFNHTHIVRYYQSWLETPPIGWEKESDEWWRKGDAASSMLLSPDVDETEDKKSFVPDQRNTRAVHKSDTLSQILNKLTQKDIIEPVKILNQKSTSSISSCSSVSGSVNEIDEIADNVSYSEDSYIMFEAEPGDTNKDNSVSSISNKKEHSSIVFEDYDKKDKIELFSRDCNNFDSESNNLNKDNSPCLDNKKFKTGRSKSESTNPGPFLEVKRRRIKSYCTDSKLERPTSLDFASSASYPQRSKLVQAIIKDEVTLNPRTYLYIQMELCRKESLKEWLLNNLDRDSIYNNILSFFNDIVQAVEYVHDRALMHRDLKPSNIFFSLDGEIKVGDFGLVTTIEEENDALTPMDSNSSRNRETLAFTNKQRTLNAGTHLYMSPEQLSGMKYNYKIDIFSLGLILFEMLVPFSTLMERDVVMTKARHRSFPDGFEEKYKHECSLLHLALHNNPEERPTTRGIRARKPLSDFQKDLESITPDEHFNLSKTKGHFRSHSGSFSAHSLSFSSS